METEDRILDQLDKQDERYHQDKEVTIAWRVNQDNRLSSIETDLKAHKEGVVQNREVNKTQDERLDKIEAPGIFRKHLKKSIVAALAIISMVVTIIAKVLGLF